MRNKTKGVIAGIAGIALLTGGSTFALWSADLPLGGGTITNGDLDVAALGDLDWSDVSVAQTPVAIADVTNWRMVPGDRLEAVQDLDVVLVGNNLVADLAVTGSAGDLPEGVTVSYDVLDADGAPLGGGVLGDTTTIELKSAQSAAVTGYAVGGTLNGTADLSVVVKVAFDADDQDAVRDVTTLSGLNVSLTQTR